MNRRQKRSSGGYGLRKKAGEKKLDDDFEYYLSPKIRKVLYKPAPKSVKLARTAQVLSSAAKYLEKQAKSISEDDQKQDSKQQTTKNKKTSTSKESSKQLVAGKKRPVGRPPKKNSAGSKGLQSEKKADVRDDVKVVRDTKHTPLVPKRGRGRPPKLKPNIQYEVVDSTTREKETADTTDTQSESDVAVAVVGSSGSRVKGAGSARVNRVKEAGNLVIDEESVGSTDDSTTDVSDKNSSVIGDRVGMSSNESDPLNVDEIEHRERKKRARKGKIFRSPKKSKLKVPEYALNENDKIECDECHKLLKPSSFRQHLRTHTGLKPFSCSMCEARFTRKGDVERHVKIVHHKEKPFKCCQCQRAFGDKKNLRWHLMNHDRKLFYACEVCGFKFGKRDYWENHVKFIHPIPSSSKSEDGVEPSGESFESTMRVVEQGMVDTDDAEVEEPELVEATEEMQVTEETVIDELNSVEQETLATDAVPVQQLTKVQESVGVSQISRTVYIAGEQAEGTSEVLRKTVLIPHVTSSDASRVVGGDRVAAAMLISGVASLSHEEGGAEGDSVREAMFVPRLTHVPDNQSGQAETSGTVADTGTAPQEMVQTSHIFAASSKQNSTENCSDETVVTAQTVVSDKHAVTDQHNAIEQARGSNQHRVLFPEGTNSQEAPVVQPAGSGETAAVGDGEAAVAAHEAMLRNEQEDSSHPVKPREERTTDMAVAPKQRSETASVSSEGDTEQSPVTEVAKKQEEMKDENSSKEEWEERTKAATDVPSRECEMIHALGHVRNRVQEVTLEPEHAAEENDTQTFEITTPGVTEEVVSNIIPAVSHFTKGQNIIVINQETLHQMQSEQPKVISITLNGGGAQNMASNIADTKPPDHSPQGKVISITVKGGDLVDGVQSAENPSQDAVQTLIDAVQELLDTAKDDGDQPSASGAGAATAAGPPEKT